MTISLVEKITWEDFSRGFHGGRIESDELCVFEDGDEKQFVQFAVQEYTSDEEDFFGVCVPKWEIILTLTDIRSAEYKIETQWRIGIDYGRANYAQEFCDYALKSIKEHGNISRLPFSEIVED
jgi:hypothetical protein